MEPESPEVCQMSAISLGRMKAIKAVPSLRSSLGLAMLESDFGYACAWAIWQLTGEEIPALDPFILVEQGWFLIPAQDL